MINSFNFRVSEKVFISTLLLKGIFTGYRIQDWLFFSFNVLKILLHGLFTYIVSNKKAAVILIFVPLYIACLNFSGCFSDFLFTTGFEQLDYDALVSFFFFFHVSCACDSLSFLDLWLYCFYQILENFGHYFFKYFFDLSSFLLYHRDTRLLEVITEPTVL